MDPTDLEWYTVILEECKSLNINNFLYNVSPYMVNCPLLPQRAASSSVSDSSHPAVVLRCHLVETENFGSKETMRERSSTPSQDALLSGEESREFDQFKSM